MSYEAGDHLAVCPVNPPELVEALVERLNVSLSSLHCCTSLFANTQSFPQYRLESVVSLEANGKKRGFLPINTPLMVSNVLYHLVDLKAVPSKKVGPCFFAIAYIH